MKVLIYAYEGQYGGLHGMYEVDICEVDNVEEACLIGEDMARSVVEDYDCFDEDFEEELYSEVYVVSDEYQNLSIDELVEYLDDWEEFVAEYCD